MNKVRLAPRDLPDLLRRASRLSGVTIGALAEALGVDLTARSAVRTKGRIGELVEHALGASAGSADIPDFPHLGVELKTIPLDSRGRVTESTFVCSIDLDRADRVEWVESRAWRKLRCVLWVPVSAAREAPLLSRVVGCPLLWHPSEDEQRLLRADWELLMGMIALGDFDRLTAHRGQALQVRPKAADASVKTRVIGPDGDPADTGPRGFYLRPAFTEGILWKLSN